MSNSDKIERLRAKAVQLHLAGQTDDAERLYKSILALHSRDVEARHMLGVLRLQQGRAAEALEIIKGVAADAPENPGVRTHYGLTLHHLGLHQEAMNEFERALALGPNNPMTLLYRGNSLLELGFFDHALNDYDVLLKSVPHHQEAWFRRGNALWQLEKYDEALASYKKSLSFDPGHVSALFNSGMILLKLGRYDEAFDVFESIGSLAPNNPHVLGGAASALIGRCDLARWAEYQELLTDAVRRRSAVIAPLTFLPFCDDGALRRTCGETFIADRVANPGPPLWTGQRYAHERIRVAYLSADFRQHATADLIAGLVERHDRSRFEVTAISFGGDDGSPMRARLIRAFDHFEDVRDMDDAAVARLLHERQFDIAVDLKGHTEGARPAILSHRPCPIQVNYLGYPGTISAPWLDYIIGDATVLPFSHQSFYSECIVHLPHCYQPNDSSRPIAQATLTRASAKLPEEGFVFCCFNAAWKITPAMFDIWMRLLVAVPGSILWLLEDNAAAPDNLRAAAAVRGVDPTRLVFAPRVESAAHLARHRLADLFLDTLPYNAHTTASDALWAGLPVVTCLGRMFDGRVAASLLGAVGMSDLVTATVEEYEALALDLARNPARLHGLRMALATNRLTHPLFDTEGFRRTIEAAYIRMVDIFQDGGSPQSFSVPA
jgi:protein O-GlcNAc transferase